MRELTPTQADVPVLVLNACRSAYAEAPPTPAAADSPDAPRGVHDRIRAYGSLAAEGGCPKFRGTSVAAR
jgi:hypothetical protein